jgi:hypothetical protein
VGEASKRAAPRECADMTTEKLTAACVFPVYSESVHNTAYGLCQCEARIGPMQVVVNLE